MMVSKREQVKARWKDCERAVAKLLNGKRVIEKGLNMEDVCHPLFSIEVKSREYVPKWLKGALSQAKTNAPRNKVPIVVVHEVGHRHANDMVVIAMGDFIDLMGELDVK